MYAAARSLRFRKLTISGLRLMWRRTDCMLPTACAAMRNLDSRLPDEPSAAAAPGLPSPSLKPLASGDSPPLLRGVVTWRGEPRSDRSRSAASHSSGAGSLDCTHAMNSSTSISPPPSSSTARNTFSSSRSETSFFTIFASRRRAPRNSSSSSVPLLSRS